MSVSFPRPEGLGNGGIDDPRAERTGNDELHEDSPVDFNPDQAVKDILKLQSGEERRDALTTFKLELALQVEALATIQEQLVDLILADPDISEDVLLRFVGQSARQYAFSPKQEQRLVECVRGYIIKHERIQTVIREVPDGRSLYHLCFGRKPLGNVDLTTTPMAIHFQIDNDEDFSYVLGNYFGKGNPDSSELLNGLDGSAAVFLSRSPLIPELKGMLIAERMSSEFTRSSTIASEHEMVHAIQQHIQEISPRLADFEIDSLLDAPDVTSVARDCLNFLRIGRLEVEQRLSNEITAYLSAGSIDTFQLRTVLSKMYTKRLGAELLGHIQSIIELFELEGKGWAAAKVKELTSRMLGDNFVKDLHNQVEMGIATVETLLAMHWPPYKISFALMNVPLKNWERVADGASLVEYALRMHEQKIERASY